MHPIDQKVLLVDDDTTMLELLRHGLSADRELYEVVCAKDAQEAIDYLERVHFPMVVADIRMPNLSGLDLLAKIRERWPHIKLILMTASPSPQLEAEIRRSGCLRLFRKPVRIAEMRALIAEELAASGTGERGFAGHLTNIKLSDLIQMCCASGISTVIQVRKKSAVGTIFIEEGEIIHADCGGIEGLEAFYEIFSWQSGRFETLGDVAVPKTTIDSNWQYLLMEGHRRMDEARAVQMEDGEGRHEPDETDLSEECLKLSVDEIEGDAGPGGGPPPGPMQAVDRGVSGISAREEIEGPEAPPGRPVSAFAAAADDAPIRVLIVDDSAVMCRVLTGLLSSDDGIRVVGTAQNGEEALSQIAQLRPDLITLDVNMPVMDGSTALKHIMIRNPCPVVIVSAADQHRNANILDFLLLGAVDYLPKPARGDAAARERLLIAVRRAAAARTDRFRRARPPRPALQPPAPSVPLAVQDRLVLVCSGAGGYGELVKIIPPLPAGCAGALVVMQAMTPSLRNPFAAYLDRRSGIAVRAPVNAEEMLRGHGYLTSGDRAPRFHGSGGRYLLGDAGKGERGFSEGDTADVLLRSAAETFEDRLMVVLLSGAETGSLLGLREIRDRGGRIVSQDLRDCLLPQSLNAARRAGLVSASMDVREIVSEIIQATRRAYGGD
jgi:two-component system chemotaxis response regulator CheB